jgi:hypothetical protein
VHPDALAVKSVARVPPLARDFSIDARAGAILYTQATGDGGWAVVRTSLDTGAHEVLTTGDSMALLPFALPDGRVVTSRGAGEGTGALPSSGPGHDHLRAVTPELALGLNELPDGMSTPFAFELSTGKRLSLRAPQNLRLDFAGVLTP